MKPLNTSNIQNQIPTTFQKTSSDKNHKTVKTTPNPLTGKTVNLPDDIVNLSDTSVAQSFKIIKPSTPVSAAEKELLLKKSATKPGLSTYV